MDARWGTPLWLVLALAVAYGHAAAECQIDQIIIALDEALIGCTKCQGDHDGDGQVTVADIVIGLNASCIPPTTTPTHTATATCTLTPTPMRATPTNSATATRTATRTATQTRTPTATPARCPLDFDDNNVEATFCAYAGQGTNSCVGTGGMGAGWQSDGSSTVVAVFSDASGQIGALASRTSATTAIVLAVAAGPDFDNFVSATGSLSLPSTTRFDGDFATTVACGDLIFSGTFYQMLAAGSAQTAASAPMATLLTRLREHAVAGTAAPTLPGGH